MIRIAGLILLLISGTVTGQQPPAPLIERDGTELLRGLLKFHNIKPVSNPEELLGIENAKLLLIVLEPRSEMKDLDLPHLSRRILRDGGGVLLAGNQAMQLDSYFPQRTGIRITGQSVRVNRSPLVEIRPGAPSEMDRFMLKNLGVLPDPGWALFAGSNISAIEPNTVIVSSPSAYARNIYAGFSTNATLKNTDVRIPDSLNLAVGSTGNATPYRSLVFADTSLLRNRLMIEARPDGEPLTDNLAFANRLVLWLRGTGENQATHCIFVENGRLVTDFDGVQFEAGSLNVPPISPDQFPSLTDRNFQRKLTETIDGRLQQWQENDGVSRSIFGNLKEDGRFRRVMQGMAIGLAVLVLLVILHRLWKLRHEPKLTELPKDTGQIGGRAPAGSVDRRCEELLQTGNHQAVVRDYLRELFAAAGFPRLADEEHASRQQCKISGTSAKTLEGALRILWEAAYGANHSQITYSRWKELEPMIESVRAAVAAGTLQMQRSGGFA